MANIKADSALIQAAGAAASSTRPVSMQSSVDKLVATHGQVMGEVAESWAEAMKAWEFEVEEASTSAGKLERALRSKTMPLDKQQDLEKEIKRLRNNVKNAGDNVEGDRKGLFGIGTGKRKKRKEAIERAKQTQIYKLNQMIQARGTDSDAGLVILNNLKPENKSLLSKARMEADHLLVAKEWAKVTGGEESDFITSEMKDGRYVYTFKSPEPKKENYYSTSRDGTRVFEEKLYNIAMDKYKQFEWSGTTEDIKDLFKVKDLTVATGYNDDVASVRKYAQENPGAKIEDISGALVNTSISRFESNPDAYSDAMYERLAGQKQSMADALHTPNSPAAKEIHQTLIQMAPDMGLGFRGDKNENNILDEKDFYTPENYEAFVNEILRPSPENQKVVYEWAANTLVGGEFSEINKAFQLGASQSQQSTTTIPTTAAERLALKKEQDKINFNKNIVTRAEAGQKLIPVDDFNTAVLTKGGYVTVKNSDVSKDLSELIPTSVDDFIQQYGGTIGETQQEKPVDSKPTGQDTLNLSSKAVEIMNSYHPNYDKLAEDLNSGALDNEELKNYIDFLKEDVKEAPKGELD